MIPLGDALFMGSLLSLKEALFILTSIPSRGCYVEVRIYPNGIFDPLCVMVEGGRVRWMGSVAVVAAVLASWLAG